jgi:N-acetylglucosamine-6-phosphate deacetylase
MRPYHRREPGIIGAALDDGCIAASLILDGLHLHPVTARLALRLLGPTRAVLVTDAVAAAGAPRSYHLGGRTVIPEGEAGRLPDGTLAGSVLTMDRAGARLVGLGWSLRDAVRMASANRRRCWAWRGKGGSRRGRTRTWWSWTDHCGSG